MNRLVAASALLCCGCPLGAETLQQAVTSAFASNPRLQEARARQQALAETAEQAKAAGRLTAAADGTAGYDRFGYGKGADTNVTASLPIWTGGRVSSAVRAAKGDVAAGAAGLIDSEAAVLESVVKAYAEVLYAQEALTVANADIVLLDQQVAEARARFDLGQATRTDVAQLEAQRASAAATLASAEGRVAAVSADYRALVGHDPGALDPHVPQSAALPQTNLAARSWAAARNPLVLQQNLVSAADRARIDQQRAERNPSIRLTGSYGYAASLGQKPYNSAAIGGLTIHVPLLTGGLVASRARQAEATYVADRFGVEDAEREAVRAAGTAWANLVAARNRENANQQGVRAAELALRGVRAEYALSLRTTLDILIADESLRAAQLAQARSSSDVLIAQAALLRADGRLDPEAYVEAPNLTRAPQDPRSNGDMHAH